MAFRKVCEFKEMSLSFLSTGGTSDVQLRTDMPGGAMADRLSGKTLPNTLGARQTKTIPLDGVRGTLFQPKLTPGGSTVLEVYEGTIWVRPIGVYLDGSLGEFWETTPIPVGV